MTLTSGCPSCAYCSGSSSGFQYCCFVNVFEFGPGELEVFTVLFVSLLFDILSCYLCSQRVCCFLLPVTHLRPFYLTSSQEITCCFPCFLLFCSSPCYYYVIFHEEDLMPYKTNNIKIINLYPFFVCRSIKEIKVSGFLISEQIYKNV